MCIKQYVTVLSIVFQRLWTALMKAAQVGDVNIVKMLMGAGASLKIKAEVITNTILYYIIQCCDNLVGLGLCGQNSGWLSV